MESSPEGLTMITNDQSSFKAAVNRPDHVGKLFLALGHGMRRCVVCDDLFTAKQAAEHANVPCFPSPDSWGTREE
jgi:hypothetical protein